MREGEGQALARLIDTLPPERREQVFTHTSWAPDRASSYERLEFLGDSVLELAIARALYDRFPDDSEGNLAKIRAHVVSRQSCAQVAPRARPRRDAARARRRTSRGPSCSGSRSAGTSSRRSSRQPSRRVYLEVGFDVVAPAIVDAFDERIEYARSGHVDSKTDLQEALARTGKIVQYDVLAVEGPAHERRFVCAALIDGEQLGVGRRLDEEGGRAGGRRRRRSPRSRHTTELRRAARPSAEPATGSDVRGRRRPSSSLAFALACTCARSSCAASSRSRTPSRSSSSPGSPSSSARTAPGSRTSRTRSSGPPGSLTPSELRAEKPDDVLFAGGGDRPPAEHCEVELAVRQRGRRLRRELDFSEVSILRGSTRGGEGQYLVNRAPVRRTDLVELLADVGLGGSMHSIVGQGKVDAVLASRPEDRRALRRGSGGARQVQAAAPPRGAQAGPCRGAGRARARRRGRGAEAAPAARPAGDRGRARREARRARSRALQARRPASISTLLESRRAAADERRTRPRRGPALVAGAPQRRSSRSARRAEDELSDAAGAREAALGALYRLQGAAERARACAPSRSEARSARGWATTLQRRSARRAARTDERGARPRGRRASRGRGRSRRRDAERRRRPSGAWHAQALLAAAVRAAADGAERRLEALRARARGRRRAARASSPAARHASRTLLALGAARERLGRGTRPRLRSHVGSPHELRRRAGARRERRAEPGRARARANEAAPRRARQRPSATTSQSVLARRATGLPRSSARSPSREGSPPAARALAAEGERSARVARGRAGLTSALSLQRSRWRASALLADDQSHGLELLERARRDGLGSLRS